MKILLINTEPYTIDRWIIKGADGLLYAANIYKNSVSYASELTAAEIQSLEKSFSNTNYKIKLIEDKV